MTRTLIIILALAPLVGVFGCNKESKQAPAENIVITFTEPTSGDTIASYNSLHSEGTISSDGNMKGYSIVYIDEATNDILFESSYDTETDAYNFHEHWLNNVSTTTQVIVRVIAKKDHDGNTETKEMTVTCLQ
ncbi:MAG: hypothetical protein HWE22_04020 [Flavobacteriales bacterium]|nr:hypothetical protein [Flavobacteriales bacterium]